MRSLWLRVPLQIVLGLALAHYAIPWMPLLGRYTMALPALAMRSGAGQTGVMVAIQIVNACPYLLAGAIAAALTWLLVRRPWDALIAAGCVAAVYAQIAATLHVTTNPVVQRWMSVGLVVDVVAVFAGCAVVSWLIERRAGRQRPVATANVTPQ